MSDLKPCPFCGGRAEKEGHDDLPLGRVKCRNCQIHTMWYANIDDAASVWNTRADSAALAAAVQAEREACARVAEETGSKRADAASFNECESWYAAEIANCIRSRGPTPAVDVLGIVREYVEAHAGLDNEFEVHSKESIAAETRFESAYNALCALATPTRKEND